MGSHWGDGAGVDAGRWRDACTEQNPSVAMEAMPGSLLLRCRGFGRVFLQVGQAAPSSIPVRCQVPMPVSIQAVAVVRAVAWQVSS
jgi:hypothetical protein